MITAIIGQDQESATTKSEWASDLIDQPRKSVMPDINLTHREGLGLIHNRAKLILKSRCLLFV